MAHIEFSLSELTESTGSARSRGASNLDSGLDRWAFVVSGAEEACLLIDAAGIVVAASPGCGALFSINAADAVGRVLVDDVLRLLDFTSACVELPEWEVDKIPPLLAVRSGVLARGLLRVWSDDVVETVDAISTPILHGSAVAGSLTFFAPVDR